MSFICDALRDLVPFVQFRKREKHGCFSSFLNCTNSTKSRNASHLGSGYWLFKECHFLENGKKIMCYQSVILSPCPLPHLPPQTIVSLGTNFLMIFNLCEFSIKEVNCPFDMIIKYKIQKTTEELWRVPNVEIPCHVQFDELCLGRESIRTKVTRV